jgi:hypothetical protein
MRQVLPTPLSPRKMILCVFLEILELFEEDIDLFEYYAASRHSHPRICTLSSLAVKLIQKNRSYQSASERCFRLIR